MSMNKFDSVTFKNRVKFGKNLGRILLLHTSITKKTIVEAYYSNNGIEAVATIDGSEYRYRYDIPTGYQIKRHTVTSKAKDGFMKIYFEKSSNFDLETEAANEEKPKEVSSESD